MPRTMKKSALTLAVIAALSTTIALAANGRDIISQGTFEQPMDLARFVGTSSAGDYDVTLRLTTGIGSGAFHMNGEPANRIYTVSDRGPNIDCEDDDKIIHANAKICSSGKIFPTPAFSPTIYTLEQKGAKGWQIVDAVQIKDQDGTPITGLSNPLTVTTTEIARDKLGNDIGLDAEGLDTEALVKLSDSTFWLAEEYGPSLVHVAPTGEVLERLVPATMVADLAAANYSVLGNLPDILKMRSLNRGAESIAISPDEQYLYFIMQSPLANPNKDAYKASRNVRLLKLDRASMTPVGEWVYVLDTPDTFTEDSSTKQNDVKVSEMVALNTDRLLVLERISQHTKIYFVNLVSGTNILGGVWDDSATSPSLEQTSDLGAASIKPLAKRVVLDSGADLPGQLPAKVEGIALIPGQRSLILINDNDFGIEGAGTEIVKVHFDAWLKN
jgi:hypothetical protein